MAGCFGAIASGEVLFFENVQEAAVTEADCGEICAAVAEFLFVGAQLRDVFAAKNSTVVPQKDDNRGLAKPE